jgi:hypothetical protein
VCRAALFLSKKFHMLDLRARPGSFKKIFPRNLHAGSPGIAPRRRFSRFRRQAPFPSSTFFAQAVSPGLLPPVNARSPNSTAPSPLGPLTEIYAKRIIAAHRTTREKHKCRLTKVTRYRLRKNTENAYVVKTYLSSGELGDTRKVHNIAVK